MINLRYDYMGAWFDAKESRHAEEMMRELGITYKYAIPQSLGDQWWFWDCSGNIENLPSYISHMEVTEQMFNYWIKESEDEVGK